MKPFNLKEAKAGRSVCTRDGRKARIICFDRISNEQPIIALIKDDLTHSEFLHSYYKNGKSYKDEHLEGQLDLMMAPEKKEGWINIYKENSKYWGNNIFKTIEEAQAGCRNSKNYIITKKIEWEK